MSERVYEIYFDILERIAINSADCREMIKAQDSDKLLPLLDQRSSLFNIYKTLQIKVSQTLNPSKEFLLEAKAFFRKMDLFDQEILEFLNQEKENTRLQIAKTFKNKETLKGYNLQSTK